MANFYIADLHLGHENILRLDRRPFADLDEMQRIVVSNWNRAVRSGDMVYILGDFCWAKEKDWPCFLSALAGQKVLIRGNHDPRQFGQATRAQFADIKNYKEISDGGRHVILSHYPIPFHKTDYKSDCWMLYGHVHATREYDFMEKLRREIKESRSAEGDCVGNWINVGCMMPWMDYTPRTLDEIIEREKRYQEQAQEVPLCPAPDALETRPSAAQGGPASELSRDKQGEKA